MFNTHTGLWSEYLLDSGSIVGLCQSDGRLYAVSVGTASTKIYSLSGDGGTSQAVSSYVEFAPLEYRSDSSRYNLRERSKYISRLFIGIRSSGNVTVKIKYDEGGTWTTVKVIPASARSVALIGVVPRRCKSFRLRLESEAYWELHSVGAEFAAGNTF